MKPEKYKTQYLIGLAIHLVFLIIMYSSGTSYKNLQIPEGTYKNNIWQCSDVMTYVDPAINFVQYHVFGQERIPDHFRTIGYPALISFFYSIAGKNWLIWLQIFQAFIFAAIYPLISATLKMLIPGLKMHTPVTIVFLLLVSGAYFTRIPMVLTDTLFTTLFMAGFYYGLLTYRENRTIHLVLFLLFITLAALVRPTASLFPLMNLAMAFLIAKKYARPIRKTMLKAVYISLALFALVNISTYRNYINYCFKKPSSVMGRCAFDYLANKVLSQENKTDVYYTLKAKIDSVPDVTGKNNLRNRIMWETVVKYPLSTTRVLIKNIVNVFFSNNIISGISNYFGYEWKVFRNACYPYKISNFLRYATYLMMVVYALIWILFFYNLILFLINRDFETFLVVGLLFIMFIVPAVLTGDGGTRFRLPFEHVLFIVALAPVINRMNIKIPRLTGSRTPS